MSNLNRRVLLAEDEIDAVDAITRILKRRGFDIISTDSGLEAVEMSSKKPVDLMLLDLSLADINGVEVLRSIRKIDSTLKIIIMTGSVLSEQKLKEIYALGIHGFLKKPVSIETLLDSIDRGFEMDSFQSLNELDECDLEVKMDSQKKHELKGLLGTLNMQCANLLSEIESGDLKKEEAKLDDMIIKRLMDMQEKIKKMCVVINE